MARPINKAEYEMLANFRYALRQFMRFSETAVRAGGITPQQHQALLAIAGFPGREQVTMGELAERLQIRHHSAVGLVDRLVLQNLVVRESGEVDRREVYISLTPQGNGILAQLSATHREELRRIGPQLNLLLQQLTHDEMSL
ncbi:MAG: MarR family transcriptional regulator [Chloroflexi bacterium]|nr:MarR family transcriptional regulator [Chloroflexota bacterium]